HLFDKSQRLGGAMRLISALFATTILSTAIALADVPAPEHRPQPPAPAPASSAFNVATVAEGLDHPWSMPLFPDGTAFATQRMATARSHADRGGGAGAREERCLGRLTGGRVRR